MFAVEKITNNVKVKVRVRYLIEDSIPEENYFLFSYSIAIENLGEQPIQLIRRQWFIFDSIGEHREVSGPGVVGQQPVIAPGANFSYESGCNLRSEIGKMNGVFIMENLISQTSFQVEIPEFHLLTPGKKN
ncbi:MAG: Co2+/Mg2+ efflux protein ApaG [Flavobacteriales bacterium]|jgi:ApaG protein